MAQLRFPPEDQWQNQKPDPGVIGPDTTPYFTENGLTYQYDEYKASWVLRTSQAVTSDSLNLALREKLDKTGGTIIGKENSLQFSNTPTSDSTVSIQLDVAGAFRMNGANKHLVFGDTASRGPTQLYVDGENPMNLWGEITSNGFNSLKPINFKANSEGPLITHDRTPVGGDDLILIDCNSNSDYGGNNVIQMSPNSDFSFKSTDMHVLTIDPTRGQVSVRPVINNSSTFAIIQSNEQNADGLTADGATIFEADTATHKLYASQDYNKALLSAAEGREALVEGNNSPIFFNEDHLLATVGFVKNGYFVPGMNVFANSPEEAEVGGLWTSNNQYYIRVE